MSFRTICVAVLLSTLPVAGCGTVANLARSRPENGGRVPFGGVKQDMACIRQADGEELGFRTRPKPESEQYPREALALFCAVDLPFSLIGDILTWPYTVTYSRINQPTDYPPVTVSPSPVIQAVPLPPATPPMTLPVPPVTAPVPLPIPPMPQPAAEGRPLAPPPQPLTTPKKLP